MNSAPHPPSDLWGQLILGFGGGCLVLTLFMGVALVYGSFEAGSFCIQNIDASRRKAARPAQALLDATGRNDFEAALALMEPAYRAQNDVATFEALIRSYDDVLIGGQAEVVDMGARGDLSWLTVRVVEPDTNTIKGTATFELVWPTPRTSKSRKAIRTVYLGRLRNNALQTRLETFLNTHAYHLNQRDFNSAHGQVDTGFTDRDTFRAFIASQGELFAPSFRFRFDSKPSTIDAQNIAVTVQVVDTTHGGVRGKILYTVRQNPGGMTIVSIETQHDTIDLPVVEPDRDTGAP